jgi:hypothetical protein
VTDLDVAMEGHVQRLASLEGLECTSVALLHGTAVKLEFEAGRTPAAGDVGGATEQRPGALRVYSPWRLEQGGRVVTGSRSTHLVFPSAGDDREPREELDPGLLPNLGATRGETVTSIQVFKPSYTLCLQFSGDIALWVFPDTSSDYEPGPDEPSVPWAARYRRRT